MSTYVPNGAYDSISRSDRVDDINSAEDKAVSESLLDTTNLAIGTNYYPSSSGLAMLPFKGLSLTGRLEDADGTITLTLEGTNDEDLASGDWHDITRGGYRPDDHTTGNANITVTSGTELYAINWDNINFTHVRVKLVTATSATNTITIKMRRKVR